MSQDLSAKIRSVALVGHGAAGKTTLAESLLAATGAITTRGSVEKSPHGSDISITSERKAPIEYEKMFILSVAGTTG